MNNRETGKGLLCNLDHCPGALSILPNSWTMEGDVQKLKGEKLPLRRNLVGFQFVDIISIYISTVTVEFLSFV